MRWYIMSVDNHYKFYWDVFVIILACYNAIALPLQIAFNEVQVHYDESDALQSFEKLVDGIFAVDIFLSFFQAYIDVILGETIRRPKLIAKHYFRQGFLVDFVSTLPLLLRSLVKGKDSLELLVTMFRLLKLLRVRRLSKLI